VEVRAAEDKLLVVEVDVVELEDDVALLNVEKEELEVCETDPLTEGLKLGTNDGLGEMLPDELEVDVNKEDVDELEDVDGTNELVVELAELDDEDEVEDTTGAGIVEDEEEGTAEAVLDELEDVLVTVDDEDVALVAEEDDDDATTGVVLDEADVLETEPEDVDDVVLTAGGEPDKELDVLVDIPEIVELDELAVVVPTELVVDVETKCYSREMQYLKMQKLTGKKLKSDL
jgi:hypothetical protein